MKEGFHDTCKKIKEVDVRRWTENNRALFGPCSPQPFEEANILTVKKLKSV